MKEPNLTDEPIWIPKPRAEEILNYFYDNPTVWLQYGIAFKYLDIRFDARTGSMLVSSNGQYAEELRYLF